MSNLRENTARCSNSSLVWLPVLTRDGMLWNKSWHPLWTGKSRIISDSCHSSNKPPFLVYLLTLHPTLRNHLEQAGTTRPHYENDSSVGHPGLNDPSSRIDSW
ncbi:hypothetical protein HZ326_25162 [Fusarium oxysporum f. sp. albedinis]|nr:hypothetical protein HZ326_25162 [Fusarium oxysporum f. sp. albedinis]